MPASVILVASRSSVVSLLSLLRRPQAGVRDLGPPEVERRQVLEILKFLQTGIRDAGIAEVERRQVLELHGSFTPASAIWVSLRLMFVRFVRSLSFFKPPPVMRVPLILRH